MQGYERAFLTKCSNCGFVFSKKIPSLNELINHYTNYPRAVTLSPVTIKRYNELLDVFEVYKSGKNILDIGCSNGLFLECALKRGWNVYGIEFAEDCIESCAKKGIKVFKSDNLPQEFFKLQFDVITSFEVIEHINNPNEDMELIKKALRNGGAFYFTTPNFNSLSRYYLKDKWNVIEYPEHLSYYSAKTAHKLLSSHGFKRKFLITTGISISRFNQSLNKPNTTKPLTSDEELRDKIEGSLLLGLSKKTINFVLNLFKIGDSLKGLYIYSK